MLPAMLTRFALPALPVSGPLAALLVPLLVVVLMEREVDLNVTIR